MQSLRSVGMAAVLAAATGLTMVSAAAASGDVEPQRQRATNHNATQQVQTVRQGNDQEIRIRVGPHNSGDINAVNDAYNSATLNQSNTTEQSARNGN